MHERKYYQLKDVMRFEDDNKLEIYVALSYLGIRPM